MTLRLKIKLDENMPADLARMFQEAGHDVTDVVQEGLLADRILERLSGSLAIVDEMRVRFRRRAQ